MQRCPPSIENVLSTVRGVMKQREKHLSSTSNSEYDQNSNMLSPRHFERDLRFLKTFLTYLKDEIDLRRRLYEEDAKSASSKLHYQQPIGAFIPLGCGHNYPYRKDEQILLDRYLDLAGW